MRICLLGKFPPIQGGVSARTFRIARGLARRGHQVHVVTNAREVESEYRVHMRDEDWAHCETRDVSGGSVTVHWTALAHEHRHIPMDPAFVTRLASTAVTITREIDAHCIFSYYLEPYCVAGYIAASITGTPHLVKLAGSDAGRLWLQADMRPVYDALLQRAATVFTSGRLGRRLLACGTAAERLQPIQPILLSAEEFSPEGDFMSDAMLEEIAGVSESPMRSAPRGPRIGIYGKLQRQKGAAVLLQAIRELRDRGVSLGLLAMCDGDAESKRRFDEDVQTMDLGHCVLRLPFVPPWRVPAFLRTCDIVCSLEHEFPIRGHAPAIFSEGMAVGRCVVASTEVALKQPNAERLIHGYNCFLVRQANDPRAVAAVLEEALRTNLSAMGRRARQFAEAAYDAAGVLDAVERGLHRAVNGGEAEPRERQHSAVDSTRSTITRLVRTALGTVHDPAYEEHAAPNWFDVRLRVAGSSTDPAARDVLRFGAQLSASLAPEKRLALCFRSRNGAASEAEFLRSVPAVCREVAVEGYEHDLEEWLRNEDMGLPERGGCTVAAIPGMPPRIVFVNAERLRVLRACDGRKTVAEVASEIASTQPAVDTESAVRLLFEDGLLELR